MDHVTGCFSEGINYGIEREVLPQQLRAKFQEYVQEHHEGAVVVYTDGTKTKNRGESAVVKMQVVTRMLNGQNSIFTAKLQNVINLIS